MATTTKRKGGGRGLPPARLAVRTETPTNGPELAMERLAESLKWLAAPGEAARLVDFYDAQMAVTVCGGQYPADDPQRDDRRRELSALVAMLGLGLSLGEPYSVSPDVADVVMRAAGTLDRWVPRPQDFPTKHGYVSFDRDVPVPAEFAHHLDRPGTFPIQAVSWSTLDTELAAQLTGGDGKRSDGTDLFQVTVVVWVKDFHRDARRELPMPWTSFVLEGGRDALAGIRSALGETLVGPEHEPSSAWKLKLLAALLLFMSQSILVTEPPREAQTFRVRRAQDAAGGRKRVRVVALRRKVRVGPRGGPTGETVDWSCRWWVLGHWRTLHRSTPAERQVWVRPYVKGPDGKPLRDAPERIFDVHR